MHTTLLGIVPASAFILAITAGTARATIGPARDLADLTAKADLIVIGAVTSVLEVGRTSIIRSDREIPAQVMHGRIAVDRVLKGSIESDTIAIQFEVPDTPTSIGYHSIEALACRTFFLTRAADHYEFVSPFHTSVVGIPMKRMKAEAPFDRVIETLAAVLRAPDVPEPRKREAVYALGDAFNPFRKTAPSPVAINALREVLNGRDATLRRQAAVALLAMNDIIALPLAEEILLGPHPDATELGNFRYGIAQGVKDEAAIPALARLLEAPEAETRRAAASALGHTLSRSAIEHLGRAIGDADFEVRLSAFQGLAEIAGLRGTRWWPTWDALRNEEDRFVRYWRSWLAQQGVRQ